MLIKDGQVLLVRHTYIDGWFMPGGGIKRGETPEQAAHREAMEEVGATLNKLSLRGLYSNFEDGRGDHMALFFSDDFTYTGQHDREIAEVRAFPLDAFPEDIHPGNRRKIEEYVNDITNPFGPW